MHSSVIIVGGGLAGLFCALRLAPLPVTILSTAPIGEGASSVWAQGGIAAALAEGDTPEKHVADTLIAGAGISDEAMVSIMAKEACARINDLLAYGVPFDRDLAGKLVQSREAAHSESRIVRVKGDTAGKAIMQALHFAANSCPSIQVISGVTAQSLVTEEGRVMGVIVDDERGERWRYDAAAIILATGGIGQLYAVTTNPFQSCGLGLAIAARAGAIISDAEFVQFHPTAINIGKDPAPLATEALRGDGAVLVNGEGERFMLPIHRDAELAPRDVVARAVFAEVVSGRGAFLDAREKIGTKFPEKFPTVHATCLHAGIDPVKDLIPVTPAQHYHMGGVSTNVFGRTSLPGLWAAGEVACTGVHGANRLASNSLLEAVVSVRDRNVRVRAGRAAEATSGSSLYRWVSNANLAASPAKTVPSMYCANFVALPLFARKVLARLAAIITAPLMKKPTKLSTVAKIMICAATDPACGETNCGKRASTKIAIFGFKRLVSRPCRNMIIAEWFVRRACVLSSVFVLDVKAFQAR